MIWEYSLILFNKETTLRNVNAKLVAKAVDKTKLPLKIKISFIIITNEICFEIIDVPAIKETVNILLLIFYTSAILACLSLLK